MTFATRPGHFDLFLLAFFQNLFHPAPFQHFSRPHFMPTLFGSFDFPLPG
jgi:hypothetical protein